MDIARPVPSIVTSISFSFLTTEDIRRVSVKQIVNPVLLDDLNRPNIGGLYDPSLGPSDKKDICATCRLSYFTCPGHFGHIELPAPVYHPLFMVNMYNLLRGTCQFCHKFKAARAVVCKFAAKLRLLEHGLLEAAQSLDDLHIRTQQTEQKYDKEGEALEMADTNDHEEAPEDFEKRINIFVAVHLFRAKETKRDDYKDGLVYQIRKEVINEFLKATILKKCQSPDCGAYAYTFRKEGHTKIIEYDLSPRQKAHHDAAGLRRPNVLLLQRKAGPATEEPGFDFDNDHSDSDTEMNEGGPTELEGQSQAQDKLARTASGKIKGKRGRNERLIAPEECRAHLRLLFRNEAILCSLLYGRHGQLAPLSREGFSYARADMFFIEVLPVSPTRFRPPVKMADTLFEHPQNELLTKVLRTSYRLRDLNDSLRATPENKDEDPNPTDRTQILASLLETLVVLQVDVNSFMDSSKNPTPVRQGKLPPAGVKQGLEKKEGLFRMHMMGKRVNHAARSVISPDVNIETNEIGVPPVFARKLTFPEPVTPYNFHEMRQLVINGREWPGASMVRFEDGSTQVLDNLTIEQRTAIANQLLTPQEGNKDSSSLQGLRTRTPHLGKTVLRHLQDGDILILNRQPTLHKPSMMAHKALVLKGEKTIRMHYANCNSYNADFDGDEMNIHFPQSQIARAEAMGIANTDNQYLVPTSGDPLRGLIQDHVVAGVWMTNKTTFFDREEYYQLLYGALRPEEDYTGGGKVVTVPPAIWKPRPMWSGKQVISTVLKNITPDNAKGLNLNSRAKISNQFWGKNSQEENVIIADGELICGVLDKSQFGATAYGLVHSVYEVYGSEVAGRLLSILGRLFSKFLQHRAFTCRMDDLALTSEGDRARKKLIVEARSFGTEAAMDNFPSLDKRGDQMSQEKHLRGLLEEVLRDDSKMANLDITVKKRMNGLTETIAKVCIPNGLLRQFPANDMQTMTMSGAKGSAVNARQISCALGQQELEGRRVPVMVSGKTLPSFKPFETAAIAGGYIASRFLTGLRPQEFYFHCMAGREGLIDTAVKTSRSGYLQRCLIKHLEGIRVHYDHTVRGSDSSVYQFQYGDDGLDVTKQKHLLEFEFALKNYTSLVNRYRPKDIAGVINEEEATTYMKKVLKLKRNLIKKGKNPLVECELAPALSQFSPSRFLGATSEMFAEKVEQYGKENPHNLLKPRKSDAPKSGFVPTQEYLMSVSRFRDLMNVRYLKSLVDPGEAVGLLASQSVGEPSTQMTLNTFHFAGHGAANVTLGIPRLREIIMTASIKPKTPTMAFVVCEGVTDQAIDIFCKKASKLTLSQLVDHITVTERFESNQRHFFVQINFFPKEECWMEYHVSMDEVLDVISTKFGTILKKEITLERKRLDLDLKSQAAGIGEGKALTSHRAAGVDENAVEEEEPTARHDENSEIGDGDAEDAKRARQSQQQATYDDDDDEEEGFDPDGLEARYAEERHDGDFESVASENTTGDEGPDQDKMAEAANSLSQAIGATDFMFGDCICSFDISWSDSAKLLLVGVIERACLKTVLREIPGISRCFRVKTEERPTKAGETDKWEVVKLMTEGSNLPGIWTFSQDAIDLNTISSNDIHAILKTYGVEAARATILREISGVFEAYKIIVNFRHLTLIADYMTFDGGYKPFNRRGISTNSSPLLKASYETTAAFIADATLHGDYDNLSSPSGSIVMGRPNSTGTGIFDVVMPIATGSADR